LSPGTEKEVDVTDVFETMKKPIADFLKELGVEAGAASKIADTTVELQLIGLATVGKGVQEVADMEDYVLSHGDRPQDFLRTLAAAFVVHERGHGAVVRGKDGRG
jgi:hypothetical protein